MFGALKRGFRSMASLILVRNVVGELQPKRTLAASLGFLAAARLSCKLYCYTTWNALVFFILILISHYLNVNNLSVQGENLVEVSLLRLHRDCV